MKHATPDNAPPVMRGMSAQDLAAWGLTDVAFVKRVMVDDQEAWSIHAANGAEMGVAPARELAFAAVRQHDLEPVSVH